MDGLVEGTNGDLYGTTSQGGMNSSGTVFRMTPGGTVTTLYNFCSQSSCTDGAYPYGGLVLATDGNFYGLTYGDQNSLCGAFGCGTIFRITPAGKLTTIHTFCALSTCPDGANPYGPLIQAWDGNLYGTTSSFGAGFLGTVFKISLEGKFTLLHTFEETDGGASFGGLVQTADGTFYGMTSAGGKNGDGTIFKMTTGGKLNTLHSFSGKKDGSTPYGSLLTTFPITGAQPTLYGTTSVGGGSGDGTIFKITPGGTFTLIFNLCPGTSCTGSQSFAGLTITADGAYYGTTAYGGSDNNGVLYVSTDGLATISRAHNFCGDCDDGSFPQSPVFQHTNGSLYGTTTGGGKGGAGTIYQITEGKPFIRFVQNAGKVGQTVGILGQGLTGTSEVLFGGVKAKFKVVSANYMTATVPANSLPEKVTVQTPSGKLTSNVPFLVEPQISSISPTSGPVGTTINLIGDSLLSTRSITIGGVPVTKYLLDNLQIFITVPSGAETGKIIVTTSGGVATSAETFTVTP